MARVLIEEDGSPTRSFRLVTDAVSIGRSDAVDMVLPDADVSRKHALLIREGEGWVIEDQKSANGITVNGSAAERAALGHGDVVVVGRFRLVFQSDDEGEHSEYTEPSASGLDEMTVPGISVAEVLAAAGKGAPAVESAAPAADVQPPSPHLLGSEGERYDLDGKVLRFGTDVPVTGVIPFGTPGELHAKDGGWWVKKTFFLTPINVNGKSISSQRLQDGDTVRVGASRFTYKGP